LKLKFSHHAGLYLLQLISRTWRISSNIELTDSNAIIAFWHGDMLPVWNYFSKNNPTGVVSTSQDGEILSTLLDSWGYKLIRGSSSKNGSEVLSEICDKLKNGVVLITPDGPRGPIHNFKAGALVAAWRTSQPLILCKVEMDSFKQFNRSWDKFRVPLPFTKIRLTLSDKIIIPQDSNREEINRRIVDCEEWLGE
jgi:lysophospholipid acyltransferase (LPLAT)-like uncharacterized protein